MALPVFGAIFGEKKRMRNNGPGLAALLIDQRPDEFRDPLLARSGRIQLAPNLGEPAINLLETPIDVTAQVNEILSESAKTRRCGISKITDFGSDLADVAVGRTGNHPGCCGVLFGGLESSIDVTEIVLTHS